MLSRWKTLRCDAGDYNMVCYAKNKQTENISMHLISKHKTELQRLCKCQNFVLKYGLSTSVELSRYLAVESPCLCMT